MQEINAVTTDIEGLVDLIFLDNGVPKLKTLSILNIVKWQPKATQELVGVYQDAKAARSLFDRLESGELLFVPKE